MLDDSIDLDEFLYTEYHIISVNLKRRRYVFTCESMKHENVMQLILTHIYQIVGNSYTIDYFISICSFLTEKEKEFYKLKYT